MPRARPADPNPSDLQAPGDPWERRAAPVAALLLLALLLQGLVFIAESSQTSDEAAHLAAGYSYLTTADFRLNPEHPPLIKEIAALPLLLLDLRFPWGPLWEQAEEWNLGRIFVHENRVPNDTLLLLGRLPVLLLSLLLGGSIFHWGRALFGVRAGLLGLALYVFDPNVVAHSSLVTTDLGVTLFMFLTVYALWRWSGRPGPWRLEAVGLAAGAALASKFTALWLLPILAELGLVLLLLVAPLPMRPWSAASPPAPGGRFAPRRLAALALAGLLALATAVAVVAACYALRGLPAYVLGLDFGLGHSAIGHNAYLMGEHSENGWWYYFLFAYLVKTPPGTLLIVVLSIAGMARGRRLALKDELFLWVPIVMVIGITCLWRVNIGLRHLLPIYPFLYLAAGRILAPRAAAARPRRLLPAAVALCLGWNLVEAASIAPYHLAYFNALAGGPRNGHRYLLDSNLDWGQASRAVKRFMAEERLPAVYLGFSGNSDPWFYGVQYQYAPGSGNLDVSKQRPARLPDGLRREVLVLSAMVLHAVNFTEHDMYFWLEERTPIAMPGYSFLAYDITGDVESQSLLAVRYLNFGLPDLADFQARRTLRLDPGNALALAVLDKIREGAAGGVTVPPPGPPPAQPTAPPPARPPGP